MLKAASSNCSQTRKARLELVANSRRPSANNQIGVFIGDTWLRRHAPTPKARLLARRGLPPLILSAGQLIAAAVLLAIVLPFAGLQPIHMRWDAIAALTVLGCLGTGIAYILNYRLITDEGTTASVVTYLLPIVAVILGAAILNDHITVQIIGGMLIVLTRRPDLPVRPRSARRPRCRDRVRR